MKIVELTKINRCLLKNRIFRSATFEGMCSKEGRPLLEYVSLYENLAKSNIGGIITGKTYISKEGKSVYPGQAAIDNESLIKDYIPVTSKVHNYGAKIFMQLVHAGRQTRKEQTGFSVFGFSNKKSLYFANDPIVLNSDLINFLIKRFGDAALNAKKAGFDGVEINAAHGYLIHQSILPSINNRYDIYGIDYELDIGTKFLENVIDMIRNKCGEDFTLIVKVSAGDDYFKRFNKKQFINLIKFLDYKSVDAIEISYGTMDYAFNIYRGDIPKKEIFEYSPIFDSRMDSTGYLKKRLLFSYIKSKAKPFKPVYNLEYARLAKMVTDIPIISVGGFRSGREIRNAIKNNYCNYVSMSRPFICEYDFMDKLIDNRNYTSKCDNCNKCVIMRENGKKTRCYKNDK